jgi:hypothetical protein
MWMNETKEKSRILTLMPSTKMPTTELMRAKPTICGLISRIGQEQEGDRDEHEEE